MNLKANSLYQFLIMLMIIISIPALFGGVMEPDSALYASISKNIVLNNDWINLYVRGSDWLDKPHLPFWIAALSFKCLGVTAFAYKLPSFLFGLIGANYVYKTAKLIYDKETGLISTLIFISALHLLISTFDVRAEIYLTTCTIASIYHYYKAHQPGVYHILMGSLFAALAIMIKGIFVLVPILAGFVLYWFFTKQLRQFLNLKWWLAILFILLFISPELYSLYIQFDLHPEKIIFGHTHVSGLKFFFWDSQFGRFFNNGPIRGRGDVSFFLHTTIWAFLPWSVLFYTAVISLFKQRNRASLSPEIIILWSSAAVTFLLFSFSKFQLPHYILIIFPQFAIITAVFLKKMKEQSLKTFVTIQTILFLLITILLSTIAILFRFDYYLISIGICLALFIAGLFVFKGSKREVLLGRSILSSLSTMIFLSVFFYPSVLNYEAGMQAGKWLDKYAHNTKPAVLIYPDAYSFDFYTNTEVSYIWNFEDLEKRLGEKNLVIYISEQELGILKTKHHVDVLKTFEYFHITKLTGKFLNVKERRGVLEHFFLVKIH